MAIVSLLKYFCIFLLKIHRTSLAYPRTVVAITVLMLGISLLGISRVKAVFAIHDIADSSMKTAPLFHELKANFPIGNTIFVLFKPSAGDRFQSEEILKIRKWISFQNLQNSEILRIVSPFDIRIPQVLPNEVWYPELIKHNTPEELEVFAKTPWEGVLVQSGKQRLGVEISFKNTENSRIFGSFDPAPVGELLTHLQETFPKGAPAVPSVYVVGDAAFQFYSHEGINRNNFLNLYLIGFLIFFFRIIFGRWRSGIIFVLTLMITTTVTFGLMGWLEWRMDLVSSGLFLLLAVAALEDFLFLCHEKMHRGTSWKKALRPLVVASFFTSLTTIIGFGSLYATNMTIMQRFGILAAVGCFIEWLACFAILPALMQLFPWFRDIADPKKSLMASMPETILSHAISPKLGRVMLVFFLLGGVAAFHLNISGAPKDMMPASHPFMEGLRELKDSWGWEGIAHIVFEDGMSSDAKSEALSQISQHTNVARTLDTLGIENYLTRGLSAGDKDMVLSAVRDTESVKSFSSETGGGTRALIYVKDTETQPMMDMLGVIERICGGRCSVTSESVVHAEFSSKVPKAFVESFGTSLIFVTLVMIPLIAFLTRGRKPYLPVLLSSFWGPFTVLILFWVIGSKVNFMTCLFMTVLVGLAGDNAIQFLFASRKITLEEGLQRRGGGSLLISLFISMACLIFLGSYFVSPRVYGLYLAAGMLIATFGDIWMLRSLLVPWNTPRAQKFSEQKHLRAEGRT